MEAETTLPKIDLSEAMAKVAYYAEITGAVRTLAALLFLVAVWLLLVSSSFRKE